MFKNDFLMQRIAELASGVARSLGLKHAQQQQQEEGDLDQASMSQLGLPLALLIQLSGRDLRLRCTSLGQVDAFRAATAGTLLASAAERYPERREQLHASALDLVLLAIEENPELDIGELRVLASLSLEALRGTLAPDLGRRAAAQGLPDPLD